MQFIDLPSLDADMPDQTAALYLTIVPGDFVLEGQKIGHAAGLSAEKLARPMKKTSCTGRWNKALPTKAILNLDSGLDFARGAKIERSVQTPSPGQRAPTGTGNPTLQTVARRETKPDSNIPCRPDRRQFSTPQAHAG